MPRIKKRSVGSVVYYAASKSYFAQRELRGSAGVWPLWSLAIGAAIAGQFFGWNYGLEAGGFWGLFIATVAVTVMYYGLCGAIAEMAAAMPHAGGAYSFARTAMGPWGGLLTGLSQTLVCVFGPAVIVVGIGSYLAALFETPDSFVPVWWLAIYAIVVGLNIRSAETVFKVAIVLAWIALAVLAVFLLGSLPHFAWDLALNIPPEAGGGRYLPKGAIGIAYALPFALWFYLAIELLPLAAEESRDARRDLPKGIMRALPLLIVTAFLVLLLNSGIAPGALAISTSQEPLFLGLETVFGLGVSAKVLILLVLAGPIASFHAIVFASGRNIFALSRAGYLPHWLSLTHRTRRTPHVALLASAAIGYLAAVAIYFSEAIFGDVVVFAVLLNMAVFGAVISYVLQCLSFILLRRNLPHLDRPYRSRSGIAGAVVALCVAAATLVFLFANPDYRAGAVGCLIWYVLALGYFGLYGRKTLVNAPEEVFAVESRAEG